jgi:hypothetical protein
MVATAAAVVGVRAQLDVDAGASDGLRRYVKARIATRAQPLDLRHRDRTFIGGRVRRVEPAAVLGLTRRREFHGFLENLRDALLPQRIRLHAVGVSQRQHGKAMPVHHQPPGIGAGNHPVRIAGAEQEFNCPAHIVYVGTRCRCVAAAHQR